ncbi:MAG: S8/S53 family peptidase [Planctomycetota bacterium]
MGQLRLRASVSLMLAVAGVGSAWSQVPEPTSSQPSSAAETRAAAVDVVSLARAAAGDGRLAFRLTPPDEAIKLLGQPTKDEQEREGGDDLRLLTWPGLVATFGKSRQMGGGFVLLSLLAGDPAGDLEKYTDLDIGRDRPLVLRGLTDLANAVTMWGVAGASLVRLDLRESVKSLCGLTFDTRTQWPPADRLPAGFDPARLLEDGKNPGLGVRGLHRQGIDGRGVHVAIIDQPLLVDHQEYAGHIERYELIDTYDVRVQMHGPPVASILIGREVGVAPGAVLSYYAVPPWKRDSTPFAEALTRILDLNEHVAPAERIRVVSVSTGMFPQHAHVERWRAACERAAKAGVLVITCELDPQFPYGTADRAPTDTGRSRNPDDPASFRQGRHRHSDDAISVPAGGRTTASHYRPDVYTYWAQGGLSWCTPYVAGVAALGFQVDPELAPQRVLALLKETATKTDGGLIIDPPGFVAAVRDARGP